MKHQFHSGKVSWQSPANIALIKYWGKKPGQIPATPSLSMTLSRSYTQCTIAYDVRSDCTRSEILLYFNGQPASEAFASKTIDFIHKLENIYSSLRHFHFSIHTFNSFPHSAGIASSASSMSAMALCITSILAETGNLQDGHDFLQTASFLARLGSGSAARSVYGGFGLWGKTHLVENSSDEYAVPVNNNIHPIFMEYGDAILVVSSATKEISSSAGHALMHTHYFGEGRIKQASARMELLLNALRKGDEHMFSEIVENEALTLHALMMSSEPGFFLFQPETISVLRKIKEFRTQTSLPLAFTIDAGPNVHLLYPLRNRREVTQFIVSELEPLCENRQWIDDEIGKGPLKLSEEL